MKWSVISYTCIIRTVETAILKRNLYEGSVSDIIR